MQSVQNAVDIWFHYIVAEVKRRDLGRTVGREENVSYPKTATKDLESNTQDGSRVAGLEKIDTPTKCNYQEGMCTNTECSLKAKLLDMIIRGR